MKLTLAIGVLFLISCSAQNRPLGTHVDSETTTKVGLRPSSEKNVKEEAQTQTQVQVASEKVSTLRLEEPREVKNNKWVRKYCEELDTKFRHWGWGRSGCEKYQWNHVRNSIQGKPLVWKVFGEEDSNESNGKNITLVMCGVHGDEITPIKFCFDIMEHLDQVERGVYEGRAELADKLIIVVPLVNPDSFLRRYPTRANARGVDVNRNFPTEDWDSEALKIWTKRFKKDQRRYPGRQALSEPETLFQVNLIKRYNPSKIISVHAPLTILDYDGPTFQKDLDVGKRANNLLMQMGQLAKGYRIMNYPFFPGSLGNYAGNERNIPTYTLELPSSDNRKHKEYWTRFKEAIHTALLHDLRNVEVKVVLKEDETKENSSN